MFNRERIDVMNKFPEQQKIESIIDEIDGVDAIGIGEVASLSFEQIVEVVAMLRLYGKNSHSFRG